jgi:myo-inositol 2-dehydrogenase / D-chiro-inositol 1-dehydrogenase
MKRQTRRGFLKTSIIGSAGLAVLPNLLPRSLYAADTPGKRIQVALIGCGREGRADVEGTMAHALARVVAVCDLDSKRAASAQQMVADFYKKKGESNVDIAVYHDYHDVLSRPDIDAVIVSVPDHQHALVASSAAIAGKHVYVQKPLTYSIAESIALRTAVRAKKIILQAGSQQRSEHPFPAFRPASEAARNGRLGKLKTIEVGIGLDKPSGKPPMPMPVPANLDYERWLGPAPEQPYMEGRVHPQEGFGRPGWITTEDFGLGMITNWGAHHLDIAQWGMGMELSGPTTITAHAEFMKNDLWTVHTSYHVEMLYANGVQVVLDNKFENGLRFIGTDGWVFCSRGAVRQTSSDPNVVAPADITKGPLRASDPKILSPLPSGAKRWARSPNHYLNWLESIVANRDPIAPVDQAGRSLQACATAWIAMKLGRKLTWDPHNEIFVKDDEANALRDRKPRKAEYDVHGVLQRAGIRAV